MQPRKPPRPQAGHTTRRIRPIPSCTAAPLPATSGRKQAVPSRAQPSQPALVGKWLLCRPRRPSGPLFGEPTRGAVPAQLDQTCDWTGRQHTSTAWCSLSLFPPPPPHVAACDRVTQQLIL
jgi:hypothetical protein